MSVSFNTIIRFIFLMFFLSVVCIPSKNVQAENQIPTKTIVVIGTGNIQGENSARAREQAIANGLVSAVEDVAVELLPPESLARNFQTFNDLLNGQTGKFVQGYRVLAELPLKNTYRVVVEAKVFSSRLKIFLSDAGILLSEKFLPKILVLISEQNIEDRSPAYWWGQKTNLKKAISVSTLLKTMENKGFPIIDYRGIPKNTFNDHTYDKPDLNDHQAVNLGLKVQADVVIIGTSVAKKTPNIMGQNIRSFKGIVSARAIRTDTGQEIAATMQSAVTANTDDTAGVRDTLSDAGSLAGEALASQIVYAWQKDERQYNLVEIIVEGTDNLVNFEKFRRIITQMSGVKNLQTKEMKADEVTITLEFQGDGKTLADALMLKTFESIGINIYEVSHNHLKIQLVPG
ncbi:MAG TPA: hypothetical protein VMW06_06405 [Desulfobacterales bacterium]|nr:hypothetical protein [Desulfobacterales bacterium]